ncbi:hypothetical protein HMPREF9141_0186 [Prevotella multiformis DSM 16608]|uniref:Uncharacterized protein n=1 Tax=Prevotella multiformis DSM 16608 TaxID=888743 RepID=F0F3M0_9BACT|nr:hypothetical protein HMPREF9141_0186 [Prevotella multiformis DSM 16608]
MRPKSGFKLQTMTDWKNCHPAAANHDGKSPGVRLPTARSC